jgi:peroxiredoxin Q/BCP
LTKLKAGDRAPAFTLPSQIGEKVSLADFAGKKNVILFFYPKDYTAGCTIEVCTFRDSYQDFQDAGAEVIGISMDSTDSHEKFAKSYNLPYILLSDTGGKVKNEYGITRNILGFTAERVTFVIDKEGIIRYVFSALLQPKSHIEKSLEILKFIEKPE